MPNNPRRKRRGRPTTLNRQRTVGIATDCYWRNGLYATSLSEVCRRANVSKPSIYREFGGEDGLMLAVVENYRDLATVPLKALLATDVPFLDVLVQLIFFSTDIGDRPAGCLLTAMRFAPGRLGPACLAKVNSITSDLLSSYEAWYRRAVSRGEADPNISANLAARFVDTTLVSTLLQMPLGVEPNLLRQQMQLALRTLMPTADWEKFNQKCLEQTKVGFA